MDPDANLKEQRETAERILDSDEELPEEGRRLAELAWALDQWIAKGGALPKAWQTQD